LTSDLASRKGRPWSRMLERIPGTGAGGLAHDVSDWTLTIGCEAIEVAASSDPIDPKMRTATMIDVLDFVGRSPRAFHVIRLPETIIVAANPAAAELYGERPDDVVGRPASSLFRGADLVHAAIALSALAAGAVDSYSVHCRSANTSRVNAWLCVRRLDVEEGPVAVAMTVPVDQGRPLDPVEEEFATAGGIRWISTSPMPESTDGDGFASPHRADGAFAVLDRLPARQREMVAALLRGERISATAASLFLSTSTVRSHLSSIYKEFGVHSQTELLALLRSPRR